MSKTKNVEAQQTQSAPAQKETTAVEVRKENAVNPATVQAEALIAQAIDKGVPVETMERLMAMRRELKAERAKELYDQAMVEFQGHCPVIKKSRAGATSGGKVAYYYAPLESIVIQTKDLIKKNGFSYAIQTETAIDKVKVTCVVKHEAGHSEPSSVEVPLGTKTGVMNASQVVAAAITFAKRYAFCNAFGILTSDEDNESRLARGNEKTVDDKLAALLDHVAKATDVDSMTEYLGKIQKSKKYTAEQKKKIKEAIDARIAELVPPEDKK